MPLQRQGKPGKTPKSLIFPSVFAVFLDWKMAVRNKDSEGPRTTPLYVFLNEDICIYIYIYIYIYTRANPCIKCTEASAVRSAVVVSSSKDIGFLSGCRGVCAPLLSLWAIVLSFVDGCVWSCVPVLGAFRAAALAPRK